MSKIDFLGAVVLEIQHQMWKNYLCEKHGFCKKNICQSKYVNFPPWMAIPCKIFANLLLCIITYIMARANSTLLRHLKAFWASKPIVTPCRFSMNVEMLKYILIWIWSQRVCWISSQDVIKQTKMVSHH